MDCEKCNVSPMYQNANISTTKPNLAEVTKLLILLRTPSELANLLIQCSDYSLLELRCKRLAGSLQTNKAVLNLISSHYFNLSWHLQRLYRVRNSLVHSSESKSNLLILSVHLNHYLRSLVAQVVYRFSSGNYTNLGELFAAFDDMFSWTTHVETVALITRV